VAVGATVAIDPKIEGDGLDPTRTRYEQIHSPPWIARRRRPAFAGELGVKPER
jgi:hypothetical protein